MRCIRSALTLALAALALGAPRASAQCEIPLIVGSSTGTANVLILLDSSGSMNEAIFHEAYDRTVNYSGNFGRTTMYYVDSDGTFTPRSFNSGWPNTPSAYLVDSDQGEEGRYIGNYLNWVFFHATPAQRAAIPAVTRIQVAKAVVNNLLGSVTSSRFAIEIFNGDNGGTILSPFGTPVAAMQTAVNGIRAGSWTPLAESMVTALNYFKLTNASAPIQAPCQKSFVIIITDGYPTQDLNVPAYLRANDCAGNDPGANCTSLGTGNPNSDDCSAYLDNVTCYMYRNDLRADLEGIQNVATFTVGFNINAPLLQASADHGGGEYFTASTAPQLAGALAAAMATISRRVAAGASVSVVAAEDRINNRLYRARYESGTWRGYVEAFDLPFRAGTPPLWESGSILSTRDPDTRTVFTSTTGTNTHPFEATYASTLQPLLGAADATEATNIIHYTRGHHVSGARDRGGWVLGDIVDASPVAVGKPTTFSHLPGYAAFRAAHAYRDEVLYVASNDGMLHCFDTVDGSERWAYVPKAQLPRLRALMDPAYCHNYFVNTTPAVHDMLVGNQWRTVLFGGEDRVSNGMFALDITDPSHYSVSVMWDVQVPGLKGSWNTPTLIRDRNANAYRLVVGTGYDANTSADSLIVLDPETGGVVARHGLGPALAGNKTTRASAIDLNFDGYDDLLYVGDLGGRMYRVDLRTSPWTVATIFSCNQPIQAPPTLTLNAMGRPMLFFGTGRFITGSDLSSTAVQSIYGLVDDGSSTTYTPTDLVNQTSTITGLVTGSHGWYVNMVEGSGERVTRGAALINGTLYVPSHRPSTSGCGGGGQAWLYSLDYKDGSAPDHANGNANDTTSGRSQAMGDGMLADPTVDLVNEAILLQSSNAVVISQTISGGLRKLMVRGWHQRWN